MSNKTFAAFLLVLAGWIGFDAVANHVEDTKAQMSHSIDQIGPNWQPPAGQG
jgi:hypothetical protein